MTDPKINNGDLRREVDDLQAYPLLTDAATRTGGTAPSGTSGSSSLGQLVDGTLREVLAWRPRQGDSKGFVAALNQAFFIQEVDGHTEWKWTPRSYAIQADMGAVTGAQASIYARAKAALDQSLPLLEGLYPLRADADTEDADAARALVRAALIELVGELGQVGGPRLQRVDAHFEALLGSGQPGDADVLGGLLGALRARFGMERGFINTIDEEQNLTNFLILTDHVVGLHRSWRTQRHFFDRRGSDVFLGTQLVLLSRALGVVAESVHEVTFALDSVYIGAAERQTVRLPLDRSEFQLTIGELLSWIETVAIDEGPRLINEGGKDGVIALRPTLAQLEQLAEEMAELSRRKARRLPPGFHTPRVLRSVESLADSLREAARLTRQLNRQPDMRVSGVLPTSARQGERVRVSIEGISFQNGSRVHLNRSGPSDLRIDGDEVRWISDQELRATFDLTGAEPGAWSVVVTSPDGNTNTRPYVFTVELSSDDRPPLQITELTPAQGPRGKIINVQISGTGFHREASSDFGDSIRVLDTAFLSDAKLEVRISIDAKARLGNRLVIVTNPDGAYDSLADRFEVVDQADDPPELEVIAPEKAHEGESIDLRIVGDNIKPGATLRIGDQLDKIPLTGKDRVWKATVDLKDATAGNYLVAVENPNGQRSTDKVTFTIEPWQEILNAQFTTIRGEELLLVPDEFDRGKIVNPNSEPIQRLRIRFAFPLPDPMPADAVTMTWLNDGIANHPPVIVTPVRDNEIDLLPSRVVEGPNFSSGTYIMRFHSNIFQLTEDVVIIFLVQIG